MDPIIKADDVAYPILQVPDLDVQEQFLIHFGLHVAERTDDALYMHCDGHYPFVHETRRGPKKFVGSAFLALAMSDLEKLSQTDSFGNIEEIQGPGGGFKIFGQDPDGLGVEVVYGRQNREARSSLQPEGMNVGGTDRETFQRINRPKRFRKGAYPQIKRYGHYALHCSDVEASLAWYNAHLGIIATDIYKPPPADESTPVGGIFSRLDRGEKPADHHTLLLTTTELSNGRAGLNHVSYEMVNIDDVFMGHEILTKHGYEPEWGIGRHYLGSQIFDYWRSPFGHVHEHQTDGDVFDNSVPPQIVNVADLGNPAEPERGPSQWGPSINVDTFGDERGL
jgi:catechol 2,3-dioxygenase-like lactoylglutathione lyase family enzyme